MHLDQGPQPRPRRTDGLFDEPEHRDEHLADCIRWWDAATIATWRLIAEGRSFDAQHITERVGRPYPGDGRRVASFVQRHAASGHIRHIGHRPTRRPTSGAVVAIWQPTASGVRSAHTVLQDLDNSDGAEGVA